MSAIAETALTEALAEAPVAPRREFWSVLGLRVLAGLAIVVL